MTYFIWCASSPEDQRSRSWLASNLKKQDNMKFLSRQLQEDARNERTKMQTQQQVCCRDSSVSY